MSVNVLDLSVVVNDLFTEIINVRQIGYYDDKLRLSLNRNDYLFIKQHLIKAIVGSSDPILAYFNTRGPYYFHQTVASIYTSSFGSTLDPATNLTVLPKELFPLFRKSTPKFNDKIFISASSTNLSTASTIIPISSPCSANTISTTCSYPSPGRYKRDRAVQPSSPESMDDRN